MRPSGMPTLLAFLGMATLLAGCGEPLEPAPPPPPQPGRLTVSLETPPGGERAIMISVSGPEAASRVGAVDAAHKLYWRASGTTFKAAVFGDITGGPLLTFAVPDVNQEDRYQASVVEVTDAKGAMRASPGQDYSLRFGR